MTSMHFRAMALVVSALVGATSASAESPKERCATLFEIYYRYVFDVTHHHDGDMAKAELAKYRCDNGQVAEGQRALEEVLQRNGLNYPRE